MPTSEATKVQGVLYLKTGFTGVITPQKSAGRTGSKKCIVDTEIFDDSKIEEPQLGIRPRKILKGTTVIKGGKNSAQSCDTLEPAFDLIIKKATNPANVGYVAMTSTGGLFFNGVFVNRHGLKQNSRLSNLKNTKRTDWLTSSPLAENESHLSMQDQSHVTIWASSSSYEPGPNVVAVASKIQNSWQASEHRVSCWSGSTMSMASVAVAVALHTAHNLIEKNSLIRKVSIFSDSAAFLGYLSANIQHARLDIAIGAIVDIVASLKFLKRNKVYVDFKYSPPKRGIEAQILANTIATRFAQKEHLYSPNVLGRRKTTSWATPAEERKDLADQCYLERYSILNSGSVQPEENDLERPLKKQKFSEIAHNTRPVEHLQISPESRIINTKDESTLVNLGPQPKILIFPGPVITEFDVSKAVRIAMADQGDK